MHVVVVQPEGHASGAPIHRHAYQSKESDTAQLRQSKLRQHSTVLRGEIRQIVGELIEPIDAGTGGWKCLR